MAGELERPSGRDGAAASDASRPTSKIPASAPETTTAAAPATQGSPPDAPMDIAESAAKEGRDLDVHMSERQPKRRRSPEDVEMAATFDQPVSGRTYEICGLLVHSDRVHNNYVEEWLTDGNGKEKAGMGARAALVAISVHNAANPEGWQPELFDKGKEVHGHKLGSASFWRRGPRGTGSRDRADGRPRNVRYRCARRRARHVCKSQVGSTIGERTG